MNIQEAQIQIGEGEKLAAQVLSNPNFSGKRPIILVIHGWTSSMARYPSRVEPLVAMGYLVLLFDLRGHGSSSGTFGTFSPHDHLNDCLTAYDYLTGLENADLSNISVIGSSYGGFQASLLTTKRQVHHLVLTVPALYPNSIFDNRKNVQRSDKTTRYRKEIHNFNDDFALQAIHEFKGDLLFIEAEKDEILPPEVMKSYEAAAQVKFTHQVIKGADHAMHAPGANEERIRVQKEWFGQFIT